MYNESLARSPGRYSGRHFSFGHSCSNLSALSMTSRLEFTRRWLLRPKASLDRGVAAAPVRYHAVAMELAAYLDEQYVEMHILTDTGRAIAIVCDKNSIFSLQRHIEQIGLACPEISAWKPVLHGNDRRAYEAAMWEGWPISQPS